MRKRMKWTSKTPDKTGIYWIKDKYTSAMICRVECSKKETCVSFIGNSHTYVIGSTFTDALWAGPIQKPEGE